MKKEFNNTKKKDLSKIAKEIFKIIELFFIKNNRACILFLEGDLGAGKTTFTKYLAKLFNEENVVSPTFILRKDYEKFIHIDAYRLEKPKEAEALKLDKELLNSKKLIIIEWSEKFRKELKIKADIIIFINILDKNTRNILIKY